jgi:hypothetical protein
VEIMRVEIRNNGNPVKSLEIIMRDETGAVIPTEILQSHFNGFPADALECIERMGSERDRVSEVFERHLRAFGWDEAAIGACVNRVNDCVVSGASLDAYEHALRFMSDCYSGQSIGDPDNALLDDSEVTQVESDWSALFTAILG